MARVRPSRLALFSRYEGQNDTSNLGSCQDPCLLEAGLLKTSTSSFDSTLASPKQPGRRAVRLNRSKTDRDWGIVAEAVAELDHCLLIVKLRPNSVQDDHTKASAPGAYMFRQYDFVTKVNGKSSRGCMLKELLAAKDELCIEVAQPRRFNIVLRKNEHPLGLSLRQSQTCRALVVTAVSDMTRIAGYDIKVSDLILSVNGKAGRSHQLIQEMKESTVLEFEIARFPPP